MAYLTQDFFILMALRTVAKGHRQENGVGIMKHKVFCYLGLSEQLCTKGHRQQKGVEFLCMSYMCILHKLVENICF